MIASSLLLIVLASAPAQDGPVLTVTVVDPTGAVLVGAHVTVAADGREPLAADTGQAGTVRVPLPAAGRYRVHVEADHFDPTDLVDLNVRRNTSRMVKLRLARVYETVDVGRSPQERASDPRSDAFATILSAAEIRELPDDPDDMERVLREMAGPGAVMRVNGFRGGRLPPKDQIAQIRFHRNMFAADAHEPGFISVDIITKPGLENVRGSSGIGFRDADMNARNAFAPERGDEQYTRGSFTLSGPLWRKHTSLSLSVDGTNAYDSQVIRAANLSGLLSQTVRRPNENFNATARIEHALSGAQQLRLEFQNGHAVIDNLGIGTFDLAERGYRQASDQHVVRASIAGGLRKALYNELRLSWQDNIVSSASALQQPTIVVPNAFTSGGAQIDGDRSVSTIEATDDLDIARGRHAIRIGILVDSLRLRTAEQRNAIGTFTFSSLAAFERQEPTTFTRTIGDPRASATMTEVGTYVQDDYRASRALMLSAGVRQEYQSAIGGVNVAPRGGVAWSPTPSGGTTIRAGAGMFFNWFDAQDDLRAVQLDGTHQQIETIVAPQFPPVGDGGVVNVLTGGRVRLATTLQQPRLSQVSFAVEQTFGPVRLNTMLMHGRGTHELRGLDVNAPDASRRRPDPAEGPITEIRSTAQSSLDAISVNLNIVRPEHRMFIAANYTLARSIDETDSPFGVAADPANLGAERGPAASDARHRVMAFASLPITRAVTAGISLNARSALPYDITTGRDDNGDSISNDRPAGVTRNTGRGRALVDVSARLAWRLGFGSAPPPPSGPQVRVLRGGDANPLADTPGGLSTKRYGVELYAQVFNALNHVNATTFAGVTTSPFFGRPVAAAQPRRIEIGARVTF